MNKIGNDIKRQFVNNRGLQIQISQENLYPLNLRDDAQIACDELIREQIVNTLDRKLSSQSDVPLDLSKKSKESINETCKELQNPLISLKEENCTKGKLSCMFCMFLNK